MCGQIFTLIITAILLDGVFGWENYFLSDYHPQINGWANIYINHHPHITGWDFWVGNSFLSDYHPQINGRANIYST